MNDLIVITTKQKWNDKMETENIKIKGRIGTWYLIAESHHNGKKVYLLEHEEYGDEAGHLIVDENLTEIMETFNGFDELDY
jgi:predicted class III extradiol MEMO1 family dioxygenase